MQKLTGVRIETNNHEDLQRVLDEIINNGWLKLVGLLKKKLDETFVLLENQSSGDVVSQPAKENDVIKNDEETWTSWESIIKSKSGGDKSSLRGDIEKNIILFEKIKNDIITPENEQWFTEFKINYEKTKNEGAWENLDKALKALKTQTYKDLANKDKISIEAEKTEDIYTYFNDELGNVKVEHFILFLKKWNKYVRSKGSQIVFVASSKNCIGETVCWKPEEQQMMKVNWQLGSYKKTLAPFSANVSDPFDSNDGVDIVDASLDQARQNLKSTIEDQFDDYYNENNQTLILGVAGASGTGKTYVTFERTKDNTPDNLLSRIFEIIIDKCLTHQLIGEINIKLDFSLLHAWTDKKEIVEFIYEKNSIEEKKYKDVKTFQFYCKEGTLTHNHTKMTEKGAAGEEEKKQPEVDENGYKTEKHKFGDVVEAEEAGTNKITNTYKIKTPNIGFKKNEAEDELKNMKLFIDYINKHRIKYDSTDYATKWLEKICEDSREINFFNGYDTKHFLKEGNRGNKNSSRDALIIRLIIQIPDNDKNFSIYIIDPPGSEKLYPPENSDSVIESINKIKEDNPLTVGKWDTDVKFKHFQSSGGIPVFGEGKVGEDFKNRIEKHWETYKLNEPNNNTFEEDFLDETRFINISLFALKLFMINGFEYKVNEMYEDWKEKSHQMGIYEFFKEEEEEEGNTWDGKLDVYRDVYRDSFRRRRRRKERRKRDVYRDPPPDKVSVTIDAMLGGKASSTILFKKGTTQGKSLPTLAPKKKNIKDAITKIINEYPNYSKSLLYLTPLKYFQNNLTFINTINKDQEWVKNIDIFFKGENYYNYLCSGAGHNNCELNLTFKIFMDEKFSKVYIYNNNSKDLLNPFTNLPSTASKRLYALNPSLEFSKFNIERRKNNNYEVVGGEYTNYENLNCFADEFVQNATGYKFISGNGLVETDGGARPIYDLRDSEVTENGDEPLFKDDTNTFYYNFFKDPIKYLIGNIDNAKKMFNTNYLNMVKLLFLIGFKKEEGEAVTRMLVYALDVRFTPTHRNEIVKSINERTNVLQKEILNTVFFHTIANDVEGYENDWEELKNKRNTLLGSFKTDTSTPPLPPPRPRPPLPPPRPRPPLPPPRPPRRNKKKKKQGGKRTKKKKKKKQGGKRTRKTIKKKYLK